LRRSSSILQDIELPKQGEERFISLQIKIIDTGIGISAEGRENLFINFNRL